MGNLEKIKTALKKDGYIILKDGLKTDSIEILSTTVKRIFTAHSQTGEDIYTTCVRLDKQDKKLLHRIYQYSQSNLVMDLLRQECFEYAKSLLPEDGIYIDIDTHVIVNLPNDDRMSWGWHQESTYHPEIKNCIGFWFPIIDSATVANGTMSVLKGSHQKGRLPYIVDKATEDSSTTLIPEDIDQLLTDFSEEHCLLDPGDLLIFDMDLVHQSNPNTSDRPRFTGLVRIACIDSIPSHFGKIT